MSRTLGLAAKTEQVRVNQRIRLDQESAEFRKQALDQFVLQQAEKTAAEIARMNQQSETENERAKAETERIRQQTAIDKLRLDNEQQINRKARAEAELAELQVELLKKKLRE